MYVMLHWLCCISYAVYFNVRPLIKSAIFPLIITTLTIFRLSKNGSVKIKGNTISEIWNQKIRLWSVLSQRFSTTMLSISMRLGSKSWISKYSKNIWIVLDYEPLKSIHLWKSIVLSKWEPTSSEWQFYWMWLSISCLQSVWTFSHLNFNQRGRYSLLKILEKITQLVHFVKPTFVTIPNWRVMF